MEFDRVDEESERFYRDVLHTLVDLGVPFMIGGAHAFAVYTDIRRDTKDLDVFIKRNDLDAVVAGLERADYDTRLAFPHWLAKACRGRHAIDVIFATGNGVGRVDDSWFEHAEVRDVFGVEVPLLPAEEMLFTKAFVMERERFDGADVAHLLKHRAERMNWDRLLELFGTHWRVLYAHLILFGFIYPSHWHRIPARVVAGFTDLLQTERERAPVETDLCRGTLLSRAQYLRDVCKEGLVDARLAPIGTLDEEDVARWTQGMQDDGPDAARTRR